MELTVIQSTKWSSKTCFLSSSPAVLLVQSFLPRSQPCGYSSIWLNRGNLQPRCRPRRRDHRPSSSFSLRSSGFMVIVVVVVMAARASGCGCGRTCSDHVCEVVVVAVVPAMLFFLERSPCALCG